IEAFVAYLRDHGHPGLSIDRCPDKENRESSDIDAIAGRFAIEHTSVDTLRNQRQYADWFTRVVNGLEAELSPSLPCRLRITVEYHAVSTGQDWPKIRQALRAWISHQVAYLADGSHRIEGVEGVPFRLHVTKASDRPPGLYFARYEPGDEALPARIQVQFDRKA